MASSELEQLRQVQESINRLKERELQLQADGNELSDRQATILRNLETRERALLEIQEKKVDAQYKGNRIAGETTKVFSDQLKELASISSIYSGLTDSQRDVIDNSREELRSIISRTQASEDQVNIISNIVSKTNELQSIQQQLAETDTSQLDLQNAIRDSHDASVVNIEKEIASALASNKITDDQAEGLRSMLSSQQELIANAEKYATISNEAKEQIAGQIEAYDKMKKTIRGTLDTIRMTLQTPQAMIVAASAAAGKFVESMAEVNRQTGMFIGSTALLSFVFDDAAGTLSTMAKLSGNVNKATFGAQLNTNILATSLGIGGEEAATLVNSFGNLQGLSQSVGEDMVSAVGSTARMNGVLPSQVMKDMAGATEEMAMYSKGTGENFANAAIQAAKLGVSIGTTAKIADNLLDFESSIEKELEASAMLGRDLNLTRARELAYAEDIEGATKEILNQVGGIDEFNQMDVYQKKAVAEALGVSVGELKQMVANQENLNTTTGIAMSYFGKLNDYARAIGDKFGGPIASGATFLVGELLRAKMTAAAIKGESILGSLVPKPVKGMFGKLFGGGAAGGTDIAGKVQESAAKTEAAPKGKGSGNSLKELASGLKAMAEKDVFKGAMTLLFGAAPAFILMTAGIVGLAGIALLGVPAGKGLTALGDGLKSFGNAGLAAFKGILLLGALGVALIPLTYALSLLAPLVESIGKAIGGVVESIGRGIGSIITSVGEAFKMILPLMNIESALGVFALAGAFTSLAAALGMFSIAGITAIPAMAAVGAFAAVGGGEILTAAASGGGGNDELLSEMRALHSDLIGGKIAVYIDGRKVTGTVAANVNQDPTTGRR